MNTIIIICSVIVLCIIIFGATIYIIKNCKKDNKEIISKIMFRVPTSALNECYRKTDDMLSVAADTVVDAMNLINNFNADKAKSVIINKNKVDFYEEKLSYYLTKINGNDLSSRDNLRKLRLDLTIGNIQFFSDYAIKLVKLAENMYYNNINFSDNKIEELKKIIGSFSNIFGSLYNAYNDYDYDRVLGIADVKNSTNALINELKTDDTVKLRNREMSTDEYYILSSIYSDCENILENVLYICENSVNTAVKKAV